MAYEVLWSERWRTVCSIKRSEKNMEVSRNHLEALTQACQTNSVNQSVLGKLGAQWAHKSHGCNIRVHLLRRKPDQG